MFQEFYDLQMVMGGNWSDRMTEYAGDTNLMQAAQNDPNRLQLLRNRLEAQIAYNEPPPVRMPPRRKDQSGQIIPWSRFLNPKRKTETDEEFQKRRTDYAAKGRVFADRQAKKDAEDRAMPPPPPVVRSSSGVRRKKKPSWAEKPPVRRHKPFRETAAQFKARQDAYAAQGPKFAARLKRSLAAPAKKKGKKQSSDRAEDDDEDAYETREEARARRRREKAAKKKKDKDKDKKK